MRPAIRMQIRQAEVRGLIHKTTVFGAQREAMGQGIIGADAVQEGTLPLTAGAGNGSAKIAGGIKDQTAAPSERVRTDSSDGQWQPDYQIASHCMHVGLDSGGSKTTKILLRISVETIIPFPSEPAVNVITVPDGESAGFCAALQVFPVFGVLGEETSALQADL